jgi:hypothetical protein
MCTVVVPLAGPDFYSSQFGIRPLFPIGSTTILEYVLRRRPWLANSGNEGHQLIFVLREDAPHTEVFRSFLADQFPFADVVTLSCLTNGACLSALAGASLAHHQDSPLVIDLADIAFVTTFDPGEYFRNPGNAEVAAVVPYFESTNPKYSYLRLEGRRVLETREKLVISTNASAGVYMFRDTASYLDAAAYCLRNPAVCQVGGASFVCPSVNGLIATGKVVEGVIVQNVQPIGGLFH